MIHQWKTELVSKCINITLKKAPPKKTNHHQLQQQQYLTKTQLDGLQSPTLSSQLGACHLVSLQLTRNNERQEECVGSNSSICFLENTPLHTFVIFTKLVSIIIYSSWRNEEYFVRLRTKNERATWQDPYGYHSHQFPTWNWGETSPSESVETWKSNCIEVNTGGKKNTRKKCRKLTKIWKAFS